jgi:hypothetical protein
MALTIKNRKVVLDPTVNSNSSKNGSYLYLGSITANEKDSNGNIVNTKDVKNYYSNKDSTKTLKWAKPYTLTLSAVGNDGLSPFTGLSSISSSITYPTKYYDTDGNLISSSSLTSSSETTVSQMVPYNSDISFGCSYRTGFSVSESTSPSIGSNKMPASNVTHTYTVSRNIETAVLHTYFDDGDTTFNNYTAKSVTGFSATVNFTDPDTSAVSSVSMANGDTDSVKYNTAYSIPSNNIVIPSSYSNQYQIYESQANTVTGNINKDGETNEMSLKFSTKKYTTSIQMTADTYNGTGYYAYPGVIGAFDVCYDSPTNTTYSTAQTASSTGNLTHYGNNVLIKNVSIYKGFTLSNVEYNGSTISPSNGVYKCQVKSSTSDILIRSTVKSYTINFSSDTGAELKVYRTSSPYAKAQTSDGSSNLLFDKTNGTGSATVYYGDVIVVSVPNVWTGYSESSLVYSDGATTSTHTSSGTYTYTIGDNGTISITNTTVEKYILIYVTVPKYSTAEFFNADGSTFNLSSSSTSLYSLIVSFDSRKITIKTQNTEKTVSLIIQEGGFNLATYVTPSLNYLYANAGHYLSYSNYNSTSDGTVGVDLTFGYFVVTPGTTVKIGTSSWIKYTLTLTSDSHSSVSASYSSSDYYDSISSGMPSVYNGSTIYYGDTINISASAHTGYSLYYYLPTRYIYGNTTISITTYPTPYTLTTEQRPYSNISVSRNSSPIGNASTGAMSLTQGGTDNNGYTHYTGTVYYNDHLTVTYYYTGSDYGHILHTSDSGNQYANPNGPVSYDCYISGSWTLLCLPLTFRQLFGDSISVSNADIGWINGGCDVKNSTGYIIRIISFYKCTPSEFNSKSSLKVAHIYDINSGSSVNAIFNDVSGTGDTVGFFAIEGYYYSGTYHGYSYALDQTYNFTSWPSDNFYVAASPNNTGWGVSVS